MLVVSYMLHGAHKVQDFKNQKAFEKFCFKVNPLDNPFTLEILEIHKYYYFIIFDNNGNYKDWARVLLKDSKINKIGNLLEWNNNVMFKSKKELKKFIKNNL